MFIYDRIYIEIVVNDPITIEKFCSFYYSLKFIISSQTQFSSKILNLSQRHFLTQVPNFVTGTNFGVHTIESLKILLEKLKY